VESVNPDVGTELINPKASTKTVFTATAASTGGEYVEIEATYPPNSTPPPLHLHPAQDETFIVLAGSLQGVRGDEEFTISAGDVLVVERGVPHKMAATGDGAVFRWRTTPALRTGEMYCAMWEVARDSDWEPSPMKLFEVISGFGDEFCLC
jgi:mannose-6-phosphate isomerase-like protein (cupin superfamily)